MLANSMCRPMSFRYTEPCSHCQRLSRQTGSKSSQFLKPSCFVPLLKPYRVLTDTKITDMASLRLAIKILHEDHGVPNVVISSIPLGHWLLDALPPQNRPFRGEPDTEYLLCIVSSTVENSETVGSPSTVHSRYVKCIPGYFSGVGDLFSALVLAHYDHPSPAVNGVGKSAKHTPIAHAVSHALSKTHAILSLTHEYAAVLPEEERAPTDEELDKKEPMRKIRRMRGRELRLVQGQDIIRSWVLDEERKMDLWEGFWA